MSDFQTLHDAFAEYERRADDAGAADRPARSWARPALVAASVVAVAGIATAAVVIGNTNGSGNDHRSAGAPLASTAPPSTEPAPAPSTESSTASPTDPTPTSSAVSSPSATPHRDDSFEARFTRALAGRATYTITYQEPEVLAGVLTTADGVSGGYDVQTYQGTKDDKPMCPDTDSAPCTIRTLPDGQGTVAYIHDPLLGAPGSITNIVELIRPDHAIYIMSVSNQRDPKGESTKLADSPPFTVDQIIDVLTSDQW